MHIVALIAAIPPLSSLVGDIGTDAPARDNWEINPYCRRAIAQSTSLASEHAATLTFVTFGPPTTVVVLQEALSWASRCGVQAEGVLLDNELRVGNDLISVTDGLFEVLQQLEEWDLLITGASTTTLGTAMLPQIIGARYGRPVVERVETMSSTQLGWNLTTDESAPPILASSPVVITCAERLIHPCKVPRSQWVPLDQLCIRCISPTNMSGPDSTSPYMSVLDTGPFSYPREGIRLFGPVQYQAEQVCAYLEELEWGSHAPVPLPTNLPTVLGPKPAMTFFPDNNDPVVTTACCTVLEPLSAGVTIEEPASLSEEWIRTLTSTHVLAFPATSIGRQRAAALQAHTRLQIIGMPIALATYPHGIEALSLTPASQWKHLRTHGGVPVVFVDPVQAQHHSQVIAIGQGVPQERFTQLNAFASALDASIVASRKVTDRRWIPRTHQVGITGSLIRSRVVFAIGTSGRPNHAIGYQPSQTVIAINHDESAQVFATANIGMVADWETGLSALSKAFEQRGWPPRS